MIAAQKIRCKHGLSVGTCWTCKTGKPIEPINYQYDTYWYIEGTNRGSRGVIPQETYWREEEWKNVDNRNYCYPSSSVSTFQNSNVNLPPVIKEKDQTPIPIVDTNEPIIIRRLSKYYERSPMWEMLPLCNVKEALGDLNPFCGCYLCPPLLKTRIVMSKEEGISHIQYLTITEK